MVPLGFPEASVTNSARFSPPSPPAIQLSTLGGVELQTSTGKALPSILVQPKRLALLAYVALSAPDGFVRRDLLLSLLWPELDDARARNALNKAVHHIRQALGDGVLINRGDLELGLAAGRFQCDAINFERAAGRQAWDEALRLYRGELLPGLYLSGAPAFEEWLERERSRLKRLGANAARRAAEARAAEGNLGGAAEAARLAVLLDPDDEPAVRRLIELLDQQGDRAGAMRVYEELAARLRRDFDVEPDVETRALRDAIGLWPGHPVDNRAPPTRLVARDTPSDRVETDPGPTSTYGRPLATRRATWALAAVALVALLAVSVVGDRSAVDVPPTGSALAVLPFAPSSSDTALARAGRDLMVLVSARLDGIGGIEVFDPIAVLAHVDMRATLRQSTRLPKELRAIGVSRVLEGSLVRAGDQLRVEGGLFTTERRTALAHFAAAAAEDDISALADSIVLQVIDQVSEANIPRATGRATLTSKSVPAVRAFLEGERLLATGRVVAARAAYERAIAADSTFMYAYWRSVYVADWLGVPPDAAAVARLRAQRQDLPELAIALFEARLSDTVIVRGRRLAAIVAQYPRSWNAWYDYADYLVHWGPVYGSTRAEARGALERSVALNPGFTNAWDHIFELSLLDSDTAAAGRALRALERLEAPSSYPSEDGYDPVLNARWLLATARGGGQPHKIFEDSAAASLAAYKGGLPPMLFDIIPLRWGWGAAQVEFGRSILARSPSRTLADGQLRGIALAWAVRGAWDSALVAADQYAAESPTAFAELFRYRLAVIGAWLGALPPAEAVRRRSGLESVLPDLGDGLRVETDWLDGLLAVTQGDQPRIVEARRRIRMGQAPMSGWLDASLHAMMLDMNGERVAALRTMAAAEADRDVAHPFNFPGSRQPLLTAVNRMVLSRWLALAGDTVAALRQLRWAEAFPPGFGLEQARVVVTGLVDLERARLEAASGQEELALAHYRQFLRRYDMPIAAHQHLVDEARTAVARLAREQK